MSKKATGRDAKGRFTKGKKGGPGRPKKITGTGKPMEDFIEVYNLIGGLEEFKRWALQNNTNQLRFYEMLFRTVPKDVAADLLLPKHSEAKAPLKIEYVPIFLQQRVDQLERFIVKAGLELPAEPERLPTKDAGNGDEAK